MDASVVDRLATANVLVVGDVLLDRFVQGHVTRISREAPVPVLKLDTTHAVLGGACNAAANALAYGGAVTLIGLVGADSAASELAELCDAFLRLTPVLLPDKSRPTTVKTRYLSGWHQLLCVDAEDNRPMSPQIRQALITAARNALPASNVMVLSDYGRGALDAETVSALIEAGRAAGKTIVVDPRHAEADMFAGATIVTPNSEEMFNFTGIRPDSDTAAEAACRNVLDRVAIEAVLLTRGEAGMTLVERNGAEPLHIRAETHQVFDVTGAGDTVIATLASALGVGVPLADAVRLANKAAGIVVTKPGTATVQPQELKQALDGIKAVGVTDRAKAAETVATWKAQGLRVGFTNGCFDLLHRGHLHSLEQAGERVDRLVVGVNTDESTERLKGPGRPVQDVGTRAAVLAALRPVDLVVAFDEDTPEELIRTLRPNVIFKGADYKDKPVPGSEFVKSIGGSVELLPLLDGHSTTGTVARLRDGS